MHVDRANEVALAPESVRQVYRRRARRYDLTSHLYGLLGYRLDAYRREGIRELALRPGCTVVEIGCGTGANLELLRDGVGNSGHVIGVDLTDAMLELARARVARHGWTNVELVLADAEAFLFPDRVDAVFSSYALTLVPGFDAVVRNAARALVPGGRMVVVDFKAPERWPRWLLRAIVPLLRPFAVTLALAQRHPWESIAKHFARSWVTERYLRATYIAVGVTGPGVTRSTL
jgi:demethylmenaquinone methyltransferase/2-methoxy-6-polyprenyl-1,4-benzoquinol methylase